MITTLASPAEHRAFAVERANFYQAMARGEAWVSMWPRAQLVSDGYRVQAALWAKAEVAGDPEATFFRLASSAASVALGAMGGSLAAARSSWVAAARSVNVALVFPPAAERACGEVDWARVRGEALFAMSDADFVVARLAQRDADEGVTSVLAGASAYLVASAMASGDGGLLTVRPVGGDRGGRRGADGEAAARAAAFGVLGAVESVRAAAFLTRGRDPYAPARD